MNKLWIEASHFLAIGYRNEVFPNPEEDGRWPICEYLDLVGLFETGWLIYNFDHHKHERNKFGYPK